MMNRACLPRVYCLKKKSLFIVRASLLLFVSRIVLIYLLFESVFEKRVV